MTLKFDGVLNKHMEPRICGLMMSHDANKENYAKWADEDMQNLLLLCKRFGVPNGPDQFLFLALALAREVVPCFQEKPKEGRPRKWDDYSLGLLAVEIERITDTGMTLDNAAKALAIRKPWNSFLEKWDDGNSFSLGADPDGAIKTAYKSAKKLPFTTIMRKAFKWHELQGTVGEWESDVMSLKGNN